MATILLVDGNEEKRNKAKGALEKAGHTVIASDFPSDALALWKKHRQSIDLVVTEKHTPDEWNAGLLLTRALRNLRSNVPIIMRSDTMFLESDREFLRTGSKIDGNHNNNIYLSETSMPRLLKAIDECLTAPVHTR